MVEFHGISRYDTRPTILLAITNLSSIHQLMGTISTAEYLMFYNKAIRNYQTPFFFYSRLSDANTSTTWSSALTAATPNWDNFSANQSSLVKQIIVTNCCAKYLFFNPHQVINLSLPFLHEMGKWQIILCLHITQKQLFSLQNFWNMKLFISTKVISLEQNTLHQKESTCVSNWQLISAQSFP